MRDKSLSICLLVLCFGLTLAGCNSRPNVSGVWKGSIQASEANGKNKWNGPAELTLNQNGDALSQLAQGQGAVRGMPAECAGSRPMDAFTWDQQVLLPGCPHQS